MFNIPASQRTNELSQVLAIAKEYNLDITEQLFYKVFEELFANRTVDTVNTFVGGITDIVGKYAATLKTQSLDLEKLKNLKEMLANVTVSEVETVSDSNEDDERI